MIKIISSCHEDHDVPVWELFLFLEYAFIERDGYVCSSAKIEKFKNVQLHAAKTVTGIPIFASHESLYFETGWESLIAER